LLFGSHTQLPLLGVSLLLTSTHPSFTCYMDGEGFLECCAEEVEVDGPEATTLTREAEVAVAVAHVVYKERMVLLMDCLVA